MLVLQKFARDTSAMVGLVLVLLTALLAVLAPRLAPHPLDAYESHPLQRLQPPSREAPFGTDNLGRDVFSRVILGSREALTIAVTVVALAMVIGVPLGLVAGYRSDVLSGAIMRVTDVFLAVPQLILALALAQLLSPSLRNAMLALALTYWPFFPSFRCVATCRRGPRKPTPWSRRRIRPPARSTPRWRRSARWRAGTAIT